MNNKFADSFAELVNENGDDGDIVCYIRMSDSKEFDCYVEGDGEDREFVFCEVDGDEEVRMSNVKSLREEVSKFSGTREFVFGENVDGEEFEFEIITGRM